MRGRQQGGHAWRCRCLPNEHSARALCMHTRRSMNCHSGQMNLFEFGIWHDDESLCNGATGHGGLAGETNSKCSLERDQISVMPKRCLTEC